MISTHFSSYTASSWKYRTNYRVMNEYARCHGNVYVYKSGIYRFTLELYYIAQCMQLDIYVLACVRRSQHIIALHLKIHMQCFTSTQLQLEIKLLVNRYILECFILMHGLNNLRINYLLSYNASHNKFFVINILCRLVIIS